ncbi:MAG: hypothetical protein J2P27_14595 [Actinobacteria bacterium]|nr:hypothetical protein [Actinomycetota bacterium]
MTVTTGQSLIRRGARWHALLRPRWLAWHSFAVLVAAGMILLGLWQLRRADAGNELSWAYVFEWPLFAAFTVYFWIRSLKDELRRDDAVGGGVELAGSGLAGGPAGGSGADVALSDGSGGSDAVGGSDAAGGSDGLDAVGAAMGDGSSRGVLTPADGEAYVEWLKAEVQHRGRWHWLH